MQFGFTFTVLLASLLVVISSQNVEAAPAKRGAGLITLPLKRLHGPRSDIHPQVLLQQHINRGNRRLARMTGRKEPTKEEQRALIQKRMFLLEHGPGSRNGKRFNRQGVSNIDVVNVKGGNDVAVLNADAAQGAVASSTASAAASANSTAGAAGANPGVSPLDIKAAAADTLTPANNPTANNSLGLDDEANDVGYIATVQLGTPPTDFKVLMDSGSADFWVAAEQCQEIQQAAAGAGQARSLLRRKGGAGQGAGAAAGCGKHQTLGTTTSSSFVDSQQPFQVTYGSGAVAGTIIQDNVVMAGLQLNKHVFGTANEETVQFTGAPFDGLMGLAQSSLSEQKTPTPVEALASNSLINDAITSYKLSRIADQKNDGQVTFGGLDPAKFQANTLTTFANVNKKGFWEGDMAAVTVNGQDTGLQGRTAILDTGTTLVIAPAQDAATVHSLIQGAQPDGQGGFTVPCTLNDSVALTFGGKSFAIDPRDIAQTPVDPANPTGDCTSGISSGNIGGATEWLVGDVFLKNAYFSTDIGKNQISLAQLT